MQLILNSWLKSICFFRKHVSDTYNFFYGVREFFCFDLRYNADQFYYYLIK